MEFKTLAIQPTAVTQFRSNEVQKTLLVHHNLDAVIFERLVVGVHHVIKIKLVHQSAAPATFHADAYEASLGSSFFREQALNLFAGVVIHFDHGVW